jgi:DNA-binding response OmpR family regulator
MAITKHVLDTVWPYPTDDDVSHLGVLDIGMLHARIDQLIEERHKLRGSTKQAEVILPLTWKLTTQEYRLVAALVNTRADTVATKEKLHADISRTSDSETGITIVDVVVCKTRHKLRSHVGCDTIETVWGRGYRLTDSFRAHILSH